MRLTKDIYEYLTNFADDKTIVNMLSVNRKFNDDQMFKRVLIRKYPLLLEFKKKTYKKLFIRMTYYINLLLKEYKIPYFHILGYNPEENYKSNNENDIFGILLKRNRIVKYQTLQIPIYIKLQKHFPDFTIRIRNQWIDMKKKTKTTSISISIGDAETVEDIETYIVKVKNKGVSSAKNIQELKILIKNEENV